MKNWQKYFFFLFSFWTPWNRRSPCRTTTCAQTRRPWPWPSPLLYLKVNTSWTALLTEPSTTRCAAFTAALTRPQRVARSVIAPWRSLRPLTHGGAFRVGMNPPARPLFRLGKFEQFRNALKVLQWVSNSKVHSDLGFLSTRSYNEIQFN